MTSGDFSFSLDLRQPVINRQAPRYIARPFAAHPVGDHALLLAAGTDRAHHVPLFYAQALARCDRFRTLDEQVQALLPAFGIPKDQEAALRLGLEGLVQRDLLRSEQQVFDLLGANPPPLTIEPIETLCIRCCQRPEELLALLKSLVRHVDGSGLRRILVLDDGPDPVDRERTAQAIEAAHLPPALSVIRIDRTDRAGLLQRLAEQAGSDLAALQWLIQGDAQDPETSYGANLNLALLLTAGQRFLMIDDDALLDPYQLQAPGPGLSLRIEHGFQTRFPHPAGDETAQFAPAAINPLTAHGELLGQPIAAIIGRHGLQEGHLLRELSPQMIHDFSLRPRLRLTTNGTLGDPGTGDLLWLFSLPTADLQPWLESPEAYQQALLGRRVARSVTETQIAAAISLMTTTLTGVDNRELLLPVGAKGRGEDLIFGALIRYLYPGTPCAALPWMLPHRQASLRRWEMHDLHRSRYLSLSTFLANRIEDLLGLQQPSDPLARARLLAAWMEGLSQMNEGELMEDLRRCLLERRAESAARIGMSLEQLDPPDWLRAEFTQLLALEQQLEPEDSRRLQDLVGRVQHFARAYGSAMETWLISWQWLADHGMDALLAPRR